MTSLKEALTILGIEDYFDRIIKSSSRGELHPAHEYFMLAEALKDNATDFRPWFIKVVKAAEEQWKRPESVFQHIGTIFIKSIRNGNESNNNHETTA